MAAKPRFLNPKTLAPPPGYTYVVETSGPGRTVYVAGQLGLDLDNKLVGSPGDFRAQCEQGLRQSRGGFGRGRRRRFNDVVKINNYLTDMSHIGIFRDGARRVSQHAGAAGLTTVAISQLARPGALFEIEAVAVLPPAKARTGNAARGPA